MTAWRLLPGALGVAAALGAASSAAAQTPRDSLAFAGPRGMYVWTGGPAVSRAHPVNGMVAHRIERRRAGERDWRRVADVEAVATAADFFAGLDSTTRAAVVATLGQRSEQAAWDHILRFPTVDSLVGIIGDDRIRLSLGIYALDAGVPPGRWQYRVSDVTQGGEAANLRLTVPVAYPSDVRFAPISSLRFEVSDSLVVAWWSLARGHAGRFLEIWRREGRAGPFRMIDSLGVLIVVHDSLRARYQDHAVRPRTMYQYYVIPRDLFANRGPASDTTTVYTVPFGFVALPDSIRVESAESTGLVLRWRFRSPALARSIRVYRSQAIDGEWRQVGEVQPTEQAFVDQSAPLMQTVYYRLTVVSPVGDESPPTAGVFGHYRSPYAPAAPSGVHADVRQGRRPRVRLAWLPNDAPDVRGYVVYRLDGLVDSLTPDAQLSAVSSLIERDTVLVDSVSAFAPGKSYGYVVQAVSTSERRSPFSDVLWVQPRPPAAPPAPTGVIGLPEGGSRGGVRLHWDDMRAMDATVSGYVVSRRLAGAADTAEVRLTPDPLEPIANYYLDSTATPGASYQYRVRARSYSGVESAPSVATRVSLPLPRVPAPGNVRAAAAPGGIVLEWDAVDDTTLQVRVYRYTRGTPPRMLAEVAVTDQSYTDRAATAGTRYYYYLTAVRGRMEGEPSPSVSARR